MEQLGLIFDQAPIAPPHAAGERRARQSDTKPRARRTDADTSHAAAARAQRFAQSHRERILGALELGRANIFEIARRAGMNHVAVARRMVEIQRAGDAEPTDERRDGARVWRLA